MSKPIRILGIAGSLRRQSYNRAALRAATQLAPEGATIDIFALDGIPQRGRRAEPTGEGRRAEAAHPRGGRRPVRHAGVQLLDPGRAQERD